MSQEYSPKIIIYLYNRLYDPLIQSNLFLYIREIAKTERFQFALITYENPNIPLEPHQQKEVDEKFGDWGIHWKPLVWLSGQSLSRKSKNLIEGYKVIRSLKKQGYKSIISLGTVAGSFAYIYARWFNMRLYLYQYEPHSEYTLDVGYWNERSIGFKFLNRLEKKSALFAHVISSGTRHMEERLINWNIKGAFFKIPSVVNQEKFKYLKENRELIRNKYGIPSSDKVILYAGKFGGLYFYKENPLMFAYLRKHLPDFHVLIVTLNDIEEIRNLFSEHGLSEKTTITSSSYDDIDKYLCAADFGIVSVESGPSKKFVSNIKVGEYLSCGLPYLICRGISEDDWYAENKEVGVVVKDFSESEIDKAFPQIKTYLDEDPDNLKQRCRKIGVEYRGFQNLYPRFVKALETLTNSE